MLFYTGTNISLRIIHIFTIQTDKSECPNYFWVRYLYVFVELTCRAKMAASSLFSDFCLFSSICVQILPHRCLFRCKLKDFWTLNIVNPDSFGLSIHFHFKSLTSIWWRFMFFVKPITLIRTSFLCFVLLCDCDWQMESGFERIIMSRKSAI